MIGFLRDLFGVKKRPAPLRWYVILYNYPEGHKDRRIKGFEGPFREESEAKAVAKREAPVWYTKIQRRRTKPY